MRNLNLPALIIVIIICVFLLLGILIGVIVFAAVHKKKNKRGQLPIITNIQLSNAPNTGAISRPESLFPTGYAQNSVNSVSGPNYPNRMIYLVDRAQGQQLLLTKSSNIIGSDENKADFLIKNNRMIDGQHAVIYIKSNIYYITDNHSTYHTYVNEVMLNPGEMQELHPNDIIRLANVNLEFLVI